MYHSLDRIPGLQTELCQRKGIVKFTDRSRLCPEWSQMDYSLALTGRRSEGQLSFLDVLDDDTDGKEVHSLETPAIVSYGFFSADFYSLMATENSRINSDR